MVTMVTMVTPHGNTVIPHQMTSLRIIRRTRREEPPLRVDVVVLAVELVGVLKVRNTYH